MDAASRGRLTREQMRAALDKARAERLQRQARGDYEPLDEWPNGPPTGDAEAMVRYEVALRQWYEKHVGPV